VQSIRHYRRAGGVASGVLSIAPVPLNGTGQRAFNAFSGTNKTAKNSISVLFTAEYKFRFLGVETSVENYSYKANDTN